MLEEQGKNPFILDSREPKQEEYRGFLEGENRYAQLKKVNAKAEELFQMNEEEAMARYAKYKKLSDK